MKAEPDPLKINNQYNDRISGSSLTLGKLIKSLKTDSNVSSRSSTTSIGAEQLQKFKDLYQSFESGQLSKDKFTQSIRDDPNFKYNDKFAKVLENPHRSYTEVLNTIRAPQASSEPTGYFQTAKTQSFINSRSLSTIGSQRLTRPKVENFESAIKDVNYDELTDKIKLYSSGGLERNEFMGYLNEKNIPISQELERNVREHETTKSVPYHKIGRCIYNILNQSESTTKLTGNPNQKDPNSFRFLNNPNLGRGDPVSKEKMKEELLLKELDKVGTGAYLTHRGKAKPSFIDNGDLTS